MKTLRVLSVCGSGTVSSSMISQKLTDIANENGFRWESVEVNANQVEDELNANHYDCICHASPIHGDFSVPVDNGIGLLTGIGEEEVVERILEIAKKLPG